MILSRFKKLAFAVFLVSLGVFLVFNHSLAQVPLPECGDMADNDGDGKIDFPSDPECTAPSDTSEAKLGNAECSDGTDNDGDGQTDYPADSDCTDPNDDSEGSGVGASFCESSLGVSIGDPNFVDPVFFTIRSLKRISAGNVKPGDVIDFNSEIINGIGGLSGDVCWEVTGGSPDSQLASWNMGIGDNADDNFSTTFNAPGIYTIKVYWKVTGGAIFVGNWSKKSITLAVFNSGMDICSALRLITQARPECSDGLDNEATPDGLIDFPADPECLDASDNDETNPGPGSPLPPPPIPAEVAAINGDKVYQLDFFDACVVDGFLSLVDVVNKVLEVDVVHKVEEVDVLHLLERFLAEGVTTPTQIDIILQGEITLDQLLWQLLSKIKDANEQFTTDLMHALFQKRLPGLTLDELQSFELAKIEKAREDVNKLFFEVMRELKEQPVLTSKFLEDSPILLPVLTSLRSKGLVITSTENPLCPWGIKLKVPMTGSFKTCLTIKQQGRIITNLDDYLFEEPLQRARDFVMCFFAPWRHFPFYYDIEGGDWDIGVDRGYCPQRVQEEAKGIENNYFVWPVETFVRPTTPCDPAADRRCVPACSTQAICRELLFDRLQSFKDNTRPDITTPQYEAFQYEPPGGPGNQLCFADLARDDLKKEILANLEDSTMPRKHRFLDTAPPESWYYPIVVTRDPNTGRNVAGFDGTRCQFIMENIVGGAAGSLVYESWRLGALGGGGAPPAGRTSEYEFYAEAERTGFDPDLRMNLQWLEDKTEDDFKAAKKEINRIDGVRSIVKEMIKKIISEEQTKRLAEYIAGQGIAPKRYLVGFSDQSTIVEVSPGAAGAAEVGLPLDPASGNRCPLGFRFANNKCIGSTKQYYFPTDYITEPARLLLSRIDAANQAMFDLAQKAFKRIPENVKVSFTSACPDPFKGRLSRADWDAKVACHPQDPKAVFDPAACPGGAGFERGWYLVDDDPGPDDDLWCRFPVMNELTGRLFDQIVMRPPTEVAGLPDNLEAPWEDYQPYLRLSRAAQEYYDYNDWLAGVRAQPELQNATLTPFGRYAMNCDPSRGDVCWPTPIPVNTIIPGLPSVPVVGKPTESCPLGWKYDDKNTIPAKGGNPVCRLKDQYIQQWYRSVEQMPELQMSEFLRQWFNFEANPQASPPSPSPTPDDPKRTETTSPKVFPMEISPTP